MVDFGFSDFVIILLVVCVLIWLCDLGLLICCGCGLLCLCIAVTGLLFDYLLWLDS